MYKIFMIHEFFLNDQDMMAPDCSTIHPDFLGQVGLHLSPGYFQWQSPDCMFETYMLLTEVRVHEHCATPLGSKWGFMQKEVMIKRH